MEFLGIGPLELFFIVLIALILLGPQDMLKALKSLGRLLRSVVSSQWWRDFMQSFRTLRNLPYTVMRESGLDESIDMISQVTHLDIPPVIISKDSGEESTPNQHIEKPNRFDPPSYPDQNTEDLTLYTEEPNENFTTKQDNAPMSPESKVASQSKRDSISIV